MNAYPNDHCPEGKVVIAPDFEILQVVVVQDAVIHTFTGGTFTVDGFVLFTVPWNTGMKPEVGAVLYIDRDFSEKGLCPACRKHQWQTGN